MRPAHRMSLPARKTAKRAKTRLARTVSIITEYLKAPTGERPSGVPLATERELKYRHSMKADKVSLEATAKSRGVLFRAVTAI